MLSFKQKLAKNYINALGWQTKRKLLLIESDDWGAIRMPSRQVYEKFQVLNIKVSDSYFDRNDSLESVSDLQNLFDTLSTIKDINGNNACVTAFSVVANPDFEKIIANGKTNYEYELITETYSRHSHTNGTFKLFREGINQRLLYPQFHGREHLHPARWMVAINSSSIKEKLSFENQAFIGAYMPEDNYHYTQGYMAAFNWLNVQETEQQIVIVEDGLEIFKQLFGFESISFVASQSIWSDEINSSLFGKGVKMVVGQQLCPIGQGKNKLVNNKWGKKNNLGQIYWRRNCTFEPARNQDYDWVNRCMKEIEIAFRWGKPAVINSHRVNYIGSIFPENRDQSLKKLKTLLKEVQKRWPDVEFIDTERLANIMIVDLNK